jgi:hypothetical protein
MAQEVFSRKRECGDDEWAGRLSVRPLKMTTDKIVEKVETLVRTDHCLGIRMTMEGLNMRQKQ